MPRLVTRSSVDDAGLRAILAPRADHVVLERETGAGRYEAVEGPFSTYCRSVEVEPGADGRRVTQTVEFRTSVPYFGWLVSVPLKRHLARPRTGRQPWWAPPDRLDARPASVLGALSALAVVVGYLNTVFSQTVAFAGEEFRADDGAQGVAGGAVRVGGLLALVLLVVADRRGRRLVLIATSLAACALAATSAVAPSLAWLAVTQMVARGFASALLVVVAIVAAEEMPARCRAYGVSLLAMASGLGGGACVLALRLADLDPRAWRLLYVLPVLALPLVRDVARRLPESRRFAAPHADAKVGGHGTRLWLLAASGFLLNLFIAPDSQFTNRFLRHERGFSGGRIALLSIGTGTPAGIGVLIGGRLADVRGRRAVAALAVVGGTLGSVLFYFSQGWPLWVWALVGSLVFNAAIPALGVYGPELFPTSLRGRANGIIAVTSLAGSAAGLLAAGLLADHLGSIAPAMTVLALGPLLLALLVLLAYPETAGRELEELNPEDRPPDQTPP